MIALDQDWSWFAFFAVDSATGNTWNFLPAYHHGAVGNYGNQAANQCNIISLPLAGIFSHHFIGGQKAINRTKLVVNRLWRAGFSVNYLYLISTAQVNTAIASFLIPELYMKFKIGEFLIGDQISARV